MASHKGCNGVVKVTDIVIAEVRDWSLNETTEILDVSAMGSCAKVKKAGMTDATGSITCLWDDSDAGQDLMINGAEVQLKLYPKGIATGSRFATLDVVITTGGASASYDGIVESTFDYAVTGPVVWGDVV